MQASTARRESLISGWSLALLAGLFAVAFIVLMPDETPGIGSLGDAAVEGESQPGIDELSLAYLRAQRSHGHADDARLVQAINALVDAARYTDAMALLGDFPELPVDDSVRIRLDLEQAALDTDTALYAALAGLLDNRNLHDETNLKRALDLSSRLSQPALSLRLHLHWAKAADTPAEALQRHLLCASRLNALDGSVLAMQCLDEIDTRVASAEEQIELDLARMALLDPGSLAHQALVDQLLDRQAMKVDAMQRFAQLLLQHSRPDLAYRVYARLALAQPARSHEWLPLAARWATAAGKPREAAVFLQARARTVGEHAPDEGERQALLQEVESLQLAAGRTREAYQSVQLRLRQQDADPESLRQGIALARQLGEVSQALAWNTQLLSFEPENDDAARLQRDLAVANGNLPLALRWAMRIVERHPESLREREQLARIAEWSGKPEEALAHWVWLAGRQQPRAGLTAEASVDQPMANASAQRSDTNTPAMGAASPQVAAHKQRIEALEQVVRLAEMTLRPGLAADSLHEMARLQKPSDRDVVRLSALYDQMGEGELAASALKEILDRYGDSRFVLRTLASHEMHHSRRESSLAAWHRYVRAFGHDVEATLAQMELLWRMDRKGEAAALSDHLKGRSLLSAASDYQVRLMAEIGWRYRKPWLSLLIRPRLQSLEEQDQRRFFGQRSLELLVDSGRESQALDEAMQLWKSTRDPDFALSAMDLSMRNGQERIWQQFDVDGHDSPELAHLPRYWAQIARYRLQQNQVPAAIQAYEQALSLDPAHLESIGGLIWALIGEQDEEQLMGVLPRYRELALQNTVLWQAMAIGYLQLGAPSASLQWFDLLLDDIEADYAMLLTYADALEYAGRSASALKVRQYTLQRLRPLLIQGSAEEQDLLLRQYSRLASRYASVESNESWFRHLLADETSKTEASVEAFPDSGSDSGPYSESDSERDDGEELWREDMAISWLMATQQYEHARLIMARLHARRLQAPVWQSLALALKDKDDAAVQAIVQARGPLSVGNHILALRQLGNDHQAYALVQQVIRPGSAMPGVTRDDVLVAREQYVDLRNAHPSFVSGGIDTRSAGRLDIDERGVRLRHSLPAQGLGLALDMRKRQLESDRYRLRDNDEQDDVALSLFFGGSNRGTRVTAGFLRTQEDELVYGSAAFVQALRKREARVSAELAYNESVELSPELIVGARQHRIALGYDTDFGRQEFLRLQADATEINTRVQESRVARGLGGSVELGMRGSFGSNLWSTSVRAAHRQHDREDRLPAELRLARDSTMDTVLSPETQSLSLGASLSRGGINADFPQAGTPRYYLSASVGQNWPDRVVGFQLGVGAGIRIVGGDELSFSLLHDTQTTTRRSGDTTAIGVNYRYHFQ